MPVSPKELELVAIGISIASGCRPCTDFHVNAARKEAAGIPAADIHAVVKLARLIKGRAASHVEDRVAAPRAAAGDTLEAACCG